MKLLFTGDVNFRNCEPLTENASREILKPFQKELDEADFRIVNLETPLAEQNLHTPIYKAGPNLICNPQNIAFLKAIHADTASMANNHIGDYGYGALRDTLALLEANGIRHCGAGNNIEEAYQPVVLEKDGFSVAIFSVCENEFGVAGSNTAGSAGYNTRLMLRAIAKAKESCSRVIVFFHGGNEHNPLPSPATQERYRLLCDMGADAVIATHTHCPQGWEFYEGKPIVYSMGNFLFKSSSPKMPNDAWYYGYLAQLDIQDDIHLKIIPYCFTQELTFTRLDQKPEMLFYLEKLCGIIADPKQLKNYFSGWAWLHPWVSVLPKEESGVAQCAAGSWDLVHCEAHLAQMDEIFRIYSFKEENLAGVWAEKIKELQKMPV